MKLKNKKIKLGKVLSEHKFVSGIKYWRIETAEFEGNLFEVGTRVSFVDPDEELHTEYNGNIEWIMVDELGNVEVSIDNLLVGRLDLEDLIII
jgi:hypothetical protein